MTEVLISRARTLLMILSAEDAAGVLVGAGVEPGLAFLALRAAEILDKG